MRSSCIDLQAQTSALSFLYYSQDSTQATYSGLSPHLLAHTMSSFAAIKLLVKEICTLSGSLSDSVPVGSKDDKIWSVMNSEERETAHETFNRRFDALFAEDCRDSEGRLHYIRQGKLGMGLVVAYLSKVNWAEGFPFDLVELKLQRLVAELKLVQCVLHLACFYPH